MIKMKSHYHFYNIFKNVKARLGFSVMGIGAGTPMKF